MDDAELCLSSGETVHGECHSEHCHNFECWQDPDLAYELNRERLAGW